MAHKKEDIAQFMANVARGRKAAKIPAQILTLEQLLTTADPEPDTAKIQREIILELRQCHAHANGGRVNVMAKKGGKVSTFNKSEDLWGFSDTFTVLPAYTGAIPVFIEIKAKGDTLKPHQKEFLVRMHLSGAIAFVAGSLPECIRKLRGEWLRIFGKEIPFFLSH